MNSLSENWKRLEQSLEDANDLSLLEGKGEEWAFSISTRNLQFYVDGQLKCTVIRFPTERLRSNK